MSVLERRAKNRKNLSLKVPPSAIPTNVKSAPNSPAFEETVPTATVRRRPSIPGCVYASDATRDKELDFSMSIGSPTMQTPHGVMRNTEGMDRAEVPYRDGPLFILPNLYLGNEKNAADRAVLQRFDIDHVVNVAKEVLNPYKVDSNSDSDDEIVPFQVPSYSRPAVMGDPQQASPTGSGSGSPGLSTSSSSSKTDDDDRQNELNTEDDEEDDETSSFKSAHASPYLMSPRSSTLPSPVPERRSVIHKSTSVFFKPSRKATDTTPSASQEDIVIIPATSSHGPIQYKKFNWTHNQENLIPDFRDAFAFIDEARSNGHSVLIHCQCGVSRSASLVIGYVMKEKNMNLNDAYEYVKNQSKWISPNMSLVYQLVDFEMQTSAQSHSRNNSLKSLLESPKVQEARDNLSKSVAKERPSNHRRRTSLGSEVLFRHNFKNVSNGRLAAPVPGQPRSRPVSVELSLFRFDEPKETNEIAASTMQRSKSSHLPEPLFARNADFNTHVLSPILASPNNTTPRSATSFANTEPRGIMAMFEASQHPQASIDMKSPGMEQMLGLKSPGMAPTMTFPRNTSRGMANVAAAARDMSKLTIAHGSLDAIADVAAAKNSESKKHGKKESKSTDAVIFAPTRPMQTPTVPTFWDVLGSPSTSGPK